jgi:hypothetical protein
MGGCRPITRFEAQYPKGGSSMSRTKCLLVLASIALLTAWSGNGWGEDKAAKTAGDRTKALVIEKSSAKIVKTSSAVEDKDTAFVNPKAEPGAVKWHATFDDACKAAAKSGKPVLLFQMMGKLDEKFC